MKIIGLCGGSGSGKGSLAGIFNKLGVPSVDTDSVYHSLISSDTPCQRELVSLFGDDIIKDGAVDRKALAKIVFSDKDKLILLNKITHKHVLALTEDILRDFAKDGYSYALVDAPLLFESGFDKKCDFTLGVLADREIRIERIVLRDGISRDAAERRINSQLSDSELIERCDFTVRNDSGLDTLENNAKKIFELIQKQEKNNG